MMNKLNTYGTHLQATAPCQNVYPYLMKGVMVLLLLLCMGINTGTAQDAATTHTVKKGETLFSIAQQYDVTVKKLKQWNDLESNQLQAGQLLRVQAGKTNQDRTPTSPSDQTTKKQSRKSTSSSYYVVKSGDTLYEIAQKHDMSVRQLKSLNNLTSNNIRVGQRLLVRQPTPTPSIATKASGSTPQGKFMRYTVKSGESWSDITQKFKMDSTELARLNPKATAGNLFDGKKLTILKPATVTYQNPYRIDAQLQLISKIKATGYSGDMRGATTSSGELYSPKALTAAHPTLSLGSIIYVENPVNRRGLFVKVNDRTEKQQLKLSERAYQLLKLTSAESRVHIYKRP